MSEVASALNWIALQQRSMQDQLHAWASINTGTANLPGLASLHRLLLDAVRPLNANVQDIELPPRLSIDAGGQMQQAAVGHAIHVVARPHAPVRVLLGIHYDTVYDAGDSFQKVETTDANVWRGPGVCDAKGGLVVMLKAIEAFERTELASNIGWEIVINPDEEVGSPSSASLLVEASRRCTLGLLFEPALPDGGLVSARKASSNLALVVHGRSAHVGRDASSGRNAIHATARFVTAAAAMSDARQGLIVNVGKIDGGGPSNVVPDLAIARLNFRCNDAATQAQVLSRLQRVAEDVSVDGISAALHTITQCPPKPLDERTQRLLELVADCGKSLGLALNWRPTGGVSDGNRLAAAGLSTVDTMGARGGAIHSHDEFILLDSLVERASLATLVLSEIAQHAGELARETRASQGVRSE